MLLKAEQLWMVATVYDKVAADTISVPSPHRAAFVRKAKRLRMLARLAAKIEATALVKPGAAPEVSSRGCFGHLVRHPNVKYKTLAERLETARVALSAEHRGHDPRIPC
jgi:hypothetical protein